MTHWKAYIAGPDVFKTEGPSSYANYAEYCRRFGVTLLYPNDDGVKPASNPKQFARNIYQLNMNMIAECDFVIVNAEPFRGPSMDVGASFEIGYAKALGLPIFAYSTETDGSYFRRLSSYYGELVPDRFGFRSAREGHLIENFDLWENLMIVHAVDNQRVYRTFEEALAFALAKLEAEPVVSGVAEGAKAIHAIQEAPHQEFPLWLEAFDEANDQHKVSLLVFEGFLKNLSSELPWPPNGSIRMLDMACGNGQFSRKLVNCLERRFNVEVEYSAIDLNADSVVAATKLFPNGDIRQANMFDDAQSWCLSEGAVDLLLLSHSIYFAKDKKKFVESISALTHANTVIMYLVNDPIHRPVPKDVDQLLQALVELDLPHCAVPPFSSYVYMAEHARHHVDALQQNPVAPHFGKYSDGAENTRRLLSFFEQFPLHLVKPRRLDDLLNSVRRDLIRFGGKIPVTNHFVISCNVNASDSLKNGLARASDAITVGQL